jgi:signal transduction histidine kinase
MDDILRGKRVLTIDDSSTIRNYLRKALGQRGAEVDGAETGEEGLALCAANRYDVVLLDLLLPDMDGLAVLKRLRKVNQDAAVVMLTGAGGIKSAMAAIQQGADGYLEKQDMAGTDPNEFYYALSQGVAHRAGIVARKQLDEVKADFYSMVTHDLRNPTGVILLSVDSILQGEAGEVTDEQREVLAVVQNATKQLMGLINDYLDFAKIDAGYLRLDLSEMDVREIAQHSAHFARVQMQAKEQTFTLDLPSEPVPARADPKRLKQVVDNLLSNAIKYTPRRGAVSLALAVDGEFAVVRITDSGYGIPPEQLLGLFQKYHRVPGESARAVTGTGLGLLIVKEIVTAHGGTVEAASAGPGKGSTFTARIPLAGPAEEA